LQYFNDDSLITREGCKAEESLLASTPGEVFQFERQGYFTRDPSSNTSNKNLQFNRTIGLRDTWERK